MKRIFIVGATSAIAEATARLFASEGNSLFLAARSPTGLQVLADDLRVRGAIVAGAATFDARDIHSLPSLVDTASSGLGGMDQALIAYGTLSDQSACVDSLDRLQEEFAVNALSVMALCLRIGSHLAQQRGGVLAVISSVAGDRGRQSNYVYGSAKAAVSVFLSGLGQQLSRSGVRVVTIKPGFVDTPMTAGFKKGPLWATPARVARDIQRAMDGGKPVLYTPWFWRPIMFIVRSIPETLFRRIKM
jgi:short-subunit dehydrogenase